MTYPPASSDHPFASIMEELKSAMQAANTPQPKELTDKIRDLYQQAGITPQEVLFILGLSKDHEISLEGETPTLTETQTQQTQPLQAYLEQVAEEDKEKMEDIWQQLNLLEQKKSLDQLQAESEEDDDEELNQIFIIHHQIQSMLKDASLRQNMQMRTQLLALIQQSMQLLERLETKHESKTIQSSNPAMPTPAIQQPLQQMQQVQQQRTSPASQTTQQVRSNLQMVMHHLQENNMERAHIAAQPLETNMQELKKITAQPDKQPKDRKGKPIKTNPFFGNTKSPYADMKDALKDLQASTDVNAADLGKIKVAKKSDTLRSDGPSLKR